MNHLLIRIMSHNQNLANCLYYDMGYLSVAIELTMEIINNYNKNLIGSDLDLIPLTVRMLQRENADKTLNIEKEPWIPTSTLSYLHENYPDFLAFDSGEIMHTDFGCLGVVEGDRASNAEDENMSVVINIENKLISFRRACKTIKKDNWIELHPLESCGDLPLCEFNLRKVHFNELDELQSFVCANYDGWISDESYYKDCIIIPI